MDARKRSGPCQQFVRPEPQRGEGSPPPTSPPPIVGADQRLGFTCCDGADSERIDAIHYLTRFGLAVGNYLMLARGQSMFQDQTPDFHGSDSNS